MTHCPAIGSGGVHSDPGDVGVCQYCGTEVSCTDRPEPSLTRPQDAPVQNTGAPSAHDLAIADLQDRRAFGLEKYKTLLQHDNGRDHLVDAYQEVLDLTVYLRNEIERRKYDPVRLAALALYNAPGFWDLVARPGMPGLPGTEQAKLWEDLRDALGLPPGTATAAGTGSVY